MQLESEAFTHEGRIPTKYTCEGDDVSPPLEWRDVPKTARSLALIVDDPDAPDPAAPKRTWVHWVVYDIPAHVKHSGVGSLPEGARNGKNDWKRTGYGGPCPPIGRHRYFFKLYALDTMLPDLVEPTKAELEHAMRGHVVAETTLLGTYQKRQ
jgi:Raf kinase inhibitor-like YbhB/YbcL family protein